MDIASIGALFGDDTYYVAEYEKCDYFKWNATIIGPKDTPYEGGVFHLDVTFPQDFPFKATKIKFATKVYHCNVSDKGGICLDLLSNAYWSPALNLWKLLFSIRLLLIEPNLEDFLIPNIAKLYKTNRKEHDKNAREWTRKYAQ